MSPANMLSTFAVLLAVFSCTVSSEESQDRERNSIDLEASNHQPQKRSAVLLEPDVTSDDWAAAYPDDAPYFLDNSDVDDETLAADKRGALFRFGKRGGSMLRYGKRGSLLRWGKRNTLFRFGKRGGSLLRFGRSGPAAADDVVDKRTLLRYGKRSDLDLLREALANQGYPVYEEPSKRGDVDGFHWGQEGN